MPDSPDARAQRLVARQALVGDRWVAHAALTLAEGRIHAIGVAPDATPEADLLIPAFHNAHSHAFQWAMRGETNFLTQERPRDDFWSWRERMYEVASRVGPGEAERIARECYAAMLRNGYASVVEFHYLHHGPDGAPPVPTWAMAEAHANAARAVGIHLVLVPVAYQRAGAGRPASARQRRFCFSSSGEFLRYADGLAARVAGSGVDVGVGVHSVRAVEAAWIRDVAAAAGPRVLHVHACEQRLEIEECVAELGAAPVEVLDREGFLGPRSTIVHGTHLAPGDRERLASSGTIVCVCPSTERDLGDGFAPALDLLRGEVRVAIGTDSQVCVEPREELRVLEYHERMRQERRNVLTVPERGLLRPAQTLLQWGAGGGAAAAGLDSGVIAVGRRADLVAIGTDRPVRTEAEAWVALERWLFSSEVPGVAGVWVEGRKVAGPTCARGDRN